MFSAASVVTVLGYRFKVYVSENEVVRKVQNFLPRAGYYGDTSHCFEIGEYLRIQQALKGA